MTDGGCGYPTSQVALIKKLMLDKPNKISYFGIEFCVSGDTMKQLKLELKGENKIVHDVHNLIQAYVEIINNR